MAASDLCVKSLLENAYKICIELLDFSKANYSLLEGDDDDAIQTCVKDREKYIGALSEIETEIDAIHEGGGNSVSGASFSPEEEAIRRSIRAVLDEVKTLDLGAMTLVSKKMHEYKMETMKARNRKHLSSYFQEEIEESSGGFDYTK